MTPLPPLPPVTVALTLFFRKHMPFRYIQLIDALLNVYAFRVGSPLAVTFAQIGNVKILAQGAYIRKVRENPSGTRLCTWGPSQG